MQRHRSWSSQTQMCEARDKWLSRVTCLDASHYLFFPSRPNDFPPPARKCSCRGLWAFLLISGVVPTTRQWFKGQRVILPRSKMWRSRSVKQRNMRLAFQAIASLPRKLTPPIASMTNCSPRRLTYPPSTTCALGKVRFVVSHHEAGNPPSVPLRHATLYVDVDYPTPSSAIRQCC